MNIPASLTLASTLALMLGGAEVMAQRAVPLPEGTQEQTQEKARYVTGHVMAVDAASGKLRVKDSAGKTRRFLAKRAKVTAAEGKVISLADLAVGDEITMTYDLTYKGKDATEIQRLHKALKR